MSKHAKTLAKMRNNPRDWSIDELKAVADYLGIDWRNEGGSHHVFGIKGVPLKICVPAHRPLKPAYVRQFLVLVDKVEELRK